MMVAAPQQQKQLIPFRAGTRQRFAPVATVPVADNSRQSVQLPRVGFASHIAVQLDAIVTITGTPGVAPLGPWDLVRRLTFRINLGTAVLYSTSGWSNYVMQRLMTDVFDAATSGDPDLYAFSTSSGDQALRLTYLIPLAANFGSDFAVGLVNLQAPEVQATLDLEFGRLVGDAYASGSNVVYKTGTQPVARIGYWYYEVPDPNRVQYPPLTFHRVLEDEVPLTTGGEVVYTVPREGVVLRLAHTLLNNTPARSNDVSEFVVRANKTDEIYRLDRWQLKQIQLFRYGTQLPTGVFVHDWWAANDHGSPGYGDTRDAISSEALSTLEDILQLASTFTAGSNARLKVVREILQFVAL
jgi:hypothetical protein